MESSSASDEEDLAIASGGEDLLDVAAESAGFGGVGAAEDAENVCASGDEGFWSASAGEGFVNASA